MFAFGREDIIPDMFRELLPRSGDPCSAKLTEVEKKISVFRYYLERHIELDGKDHGPLAIRLVEQLNGQVSKKTFLTSFPISNFAEHEQLEEVNCSSEHSAAETLRSVGRGGRPEQGRCLRREDFQSEGRS